MPTPLLTRRAFLATTAMATMTAAISRATESRMPLIGYTEYRTNLPTRYDNMITARACVVRADGTGREALAPELAQEAHAWTQFASWSPDGKLAILGRGWETPENGAWEEEHKDFRMTEG